MVDQEPPVRMNAEGSQQCLHRSFFSVASAARRRGLMSGRPTFGFRTFHNRLSFSEEKIFSSAADGVQDQADFSIAAYRARWRKVCSPSLAFIPTCELVT